MRAGSGLLVVSVFGAALTSEFDLISRYFSRPAPGDMLGVGDDCALFSAPAGMQVATSTDLLIEGRHFFSDVDPTALGHKALAVNLSDLAAMGARPIGCVLGLALPAIDEVWLASFAQGFHALAQRHGCPLLGGDTTRSLQGLSISVTVFGAVAASQALRRDAARSGDDIWVSGALGAADTAYRLLAGRLPADAVRLAATRQALEWPQPQVELGLALAGLAHAAIDISDGLLQDLGHILQASHLGASLNYGAMPVAPALAGLTPPQLRQAVLGGGDVYELCFTAAPEQRGRIAALAAQLGLTLTRIGHTVSEPGLVVLDANGKEVKRVSDYQSSKQILAFLQRP